ncbi:mediator of RNA polymerase II transcription subunit 9 [Atheta coriaria]|uniref:mediator of RNA polymerase II transcription subunit 9 n=1 Tax=Dalotia coriaria TaxID=877792 RepID=UPI0031F3AE0D
MEVVDSSAANVQPTTKLTVDDLNIEILPVIYEIIRGVEKDHHDNTVKVRESQDCSQKVLELQKRLEQTRTQIKQLPGIEFSKEQQLQHLESLKTQLKLKQELLQKYRYLAFDIKRENC